MNLIRQIRVFILDLKRDLCKERVVAERDFKLNFGQKQVIFISHKTNYKVYALKRHVAGVLIDIEVV